MRRTPAPLPASSSFSSSSRRHTTAPPSRFPTPTVTRPPTRPTRFSSRTPTRRPTLSADEIRIVMTLPVTMSFMSWRDIVTLTEVCKCLHSELKRDEEEYWKLICTEFARDSGMFVPPVSWPLGCGYRKVFFDHLKPSVSQTDIRATNIQVSIRFRPGSRQEEALFLPLAQLLKVCKNLPLKSDPQEFLDPLTNILMRDPVMLPTSGKVMERSVIERQLAHSGIDPFSGEELATAQLVALPELRNRIDQWRATKCSITDVCISSDEVRQFIERSSGADLDPSILLMLCEAQMLERAAKLSNYADATPNLSNLQGVVNTQPDDGTGTGVGVVNDIAVLQGPDQSDDDIEFIDAVESIDGASRSTQAQENLMSSNKQETNTAHNTSVDTKASEKEEVPFLGWQRPENSAKVLHVSSTAVTMYTSEAGLRQFRFPFVFGETSIQQQVYESCALPLVVSTLNGVNNCLMCYGQTGSGKTHTTFGPPRFISSSLSLDPSNLSPEAGIVFRIFRDLFEGIRLLGAMDVRVSVVVQYVQIYFERITCLFSGAAGRATSDGTIHGAQRISVTCFGDVVEVLRKGEANKRYATTRMNTSSSRAHTVMVVTINKVIGSRDKLVQSTLHLVDLAGSERLNKSGAHGTHRDEAVSINTSLLVLGKCISALVNQESHVPFFESSLTTLLRPAFGGASRTSVIVNCHLGDAHAFETLHSLRFGERCSVIKNELQSMNLQLSTVVHEIDHALVLCERQMARLEQHGQTSLQVYSNLKRRYQDLTLKREELVL